MFKKNELVEVLRQLVLSYSVTRLFPNDEIREMELEERIDEARPLIEDVREAEGHGVVMDAMNEAFTDVAVLTMKRLRPDIWDECSAFVVSFIKN
jgi:hypothetical protein